MNAFANYLLCAFYNQLDNIVSSPTVFICVDRGIRTHTFAHILADAITEDYRNNP